MMPDAGLATGLVDAVLHTRLLSADELLLCFTQGECLFESIRNLSIGPFCGDYLQAVPQSTDNHAANQQKLYTISLIASS